MVGTLSECLVKGDAMSAPFCRAVAGPVRDQEAPSRTTPA